MATWEREQRSLCSLRFGAEERHDLLSGVHGVLIGDDTVPKKENVKFQDGAKVPLKIVLDVLASRWEVSKGMS